MSSDRNQPCPCGSGKKYKHCCLNRDFAAPSAELPAAALKPHAGGVEKAMDWLENRHRKGWKTAFLNLYQELLSEPDRAQLTRLDQETKSSIQINLTEWLLAEGEIQVQGGMRRICEHLIGPSGPDWTPGQRDWLLQLGQRQLRLYHVTDVEPGSSLTLCDALNGNAAPVRVQEQSGSRALTPGMYLGGRIMRVADHFELSGAAYPFNLVIGPMMEERLRATAQEFGDLPDLAQEQTLVLMAAWLQQFVAPASLPTLLDQQSGEPILLITDHYRVLDWTAMSLALQGCADVAGNQQDGWSRNIDGSDGQVRSLAHINLGKNEQQIEVFYKTRRNADQGRAWFDALTVGTSKFLTRKVVDPQDVVTRKPKRGLRNTSAASLSEVDPLVLAQAMEEMIRRTYANWADEPIPMLNHTTPRQAIQTAAGLERVKGLLRSYENGEKTQAAQQGRSEVSYRFLWESLGLAH